MRVGKPAKAAESCPLTIVALLLQGIPIESIIACDPASSSPARTVAELGNWELHKLTDCLKSGSQQIVKRMGSAVRLTDEAKSMIKECMPAYSFAEAIVFDPPRQRHEKLGGESLIAQSSQLTRLEELDFLFGKGFEDSLRPRSYRPLRSTYDIICRQSRVDQMKKLLEFLTIKDSEDYDKCLKDEIYRINNVMKAEKKWFPTTGSNYRGVIAARVAESLAEGLGELRASGVSTERVEYEKIWRTAVNKVYFPHHDLAKEFLNRLEGTEDFRPIPKHVLYFIGKYAPRLIDNNAEYIFLNCLLDWRSSNINPDEWNPEQMRAVIDTNLNLKGIIDPRRRVPPQLTPLDLTDDGCTYKPLSVWRKKLSWYHLHFALSDTLRIFSVILEPCLDPRLGPRRFFKTLQTQLARMGDELNQSNINTSNLLRSFFAEFRAFMLDCRVDKTIYKIECTICKDRGSSVFKALSAPLAWHDVRGVPVVDNPEEEDANVDGPPATRPHALIMEEFDYDQEGEQDRVIRGRSSL